MAAYATYPHLAALAEETIMINIKGQYTAPDGTQRHIAKRIKASNNGTRHVKSAPSPFSPLTDKIPTIHITTEGTIDALRRLHSPKTEEILGCLNFASATKPGGGFRKGTLAQEESLAYASSLHSSLSQVPEFYDAHNKMLDAGDPPLYSDRVIISPDVVFFRNNKFELLDEPFQATVLTCAAPRRAAICEEYPDTVRLIPETLKTRIEVIFLTALFAKIKYFVLGAWGCGVFGNDPVLVATLFKEMIDKYGGYFEHIVFAI